MLSNTDAQFLQNHSHVWIDNDLKDSFEKTWLSAKRNQGLIFSKTNTWNEIIRYLQKRDEELERLQEELSKKMYNTIPNQIHSSESDSDADQLSSSMSVSDSEIELLLDLDAKKKAEESRREKEKVTFYPDRPRELTPHDYGFKRVRRNASVIYKRKPTKSEERDILFRFFEKNENPSVEEARQLSERISWDIKRVKQWFSNRRSIKKRELETIM